MLPLDADMMRSYTAFGLQKIVSLLTANRIRDQQAIVSISQRMLLKFTAMVLIVWSFAAACGSGDRNDRPEAVVWAMFKAAGAGDVNGYLDCFSEQLKEKLGSTSGEMGKEQFGQYLTETSKSIMGIAITDKEQMSEDKIQLGVELIFKDKNEVQRLVLRKERGAWKIAEISDSARIKTLIPYGTELSQ